MTKIHTNSFVKRQTDASEFSHFEGTWEFLEALVEMNFPIAKPGYRDGVVLVPLDAEYMIGGSTVSFFSGVATLKEGDELQGFYKARRPGETPRKSVGAVGCKKTPARSVEVVLYASTVLAEGGDNELPAEEGNWEIISINANPCEGEMPIAPNVLMHNHFGSDGGTETGLSDEKFVEMLRASFLFWKDKTMMAPKE